jgi:hypothetical protein
VARKLIDFDAEMLQALELLDRDSMRDMQAERTKVCLSISSSPTMRSAAAA